MVILIENYDNLPALTIFLPASCLDSNKVKMTTDLLRRITLEDELKTILIARCIGQIDIAASEFSLETYSATNLANRNANPEEQLLKADIRPFGRWYTNNIERKTDIMSFKEIFCAKKEDILLNSKEFYINLLFQLAKSSNPEVGHYIERSWAGILNVQNVDSTLSIDNYI